MVFNIPLGNDTFTILRAPKVDSPRGTSQFYDWDSAVETVITEAKVNPYKLAEKLSFEVTGAHERQLAGSGLKNYAPPGTDVRHDDRIVYRNQTYTVFGHAGIWTDFEGNESHVELTVQL